MIKSALRVTRAVRHVVGTATVGACVGALAGAYWSLVREDERETSLAALAGTLDGLSDLVREHLRGRLDNRDLANRLRDSLSNMLSPSIGEDELAQIREKPPVLTNLRKLH